MKLWTYRCEYPNPLGGKDIVNMGMFLTYVKARDSKKRMKRLGARVSNIVGVDYDECK